MRFGSEIASIDRGPTDLEYPIDTDMILYQKIKL